MHFFSSTTRKVFQLTSYLSYYQPSSSLPFSLPPHRLAFNGRLHVHILPSLFLSLSLSFLPHPYHHILCIPLNASILNLFFLSESVAHSPTPSNRATMDTTSFPPHNPSTTLINAPPPGVTVDDHPRALREGVQVTSQNRCAYCDKKVHEADACKYLSPGIHKIHWNPYPDLWVYQPGAKNGKVTRRKKSCGWQVDPQTWTNFKGHGSVNSSMSIQWTS